MTEPLVKSVRLVPASDEGRVGHPWDLPAIARLAEGLELHPKVTYLIGENGSGKSSLLSAIAMAAGMNAFLAKPVSPAALAQALAKFAV